MKPADAATTPAPRRLSIRAFVVLAVIWSLAPALLRATRLDSTYSFPSQHQVNVLVANMFIGVLVVSIFITRWRWWPIVLVETLRLPRWVWVVPAAMFASAVAFIDYARLADAGATLTITLLIGSLAIGVSEELMFRGVALEFFRVRFTERRAALFTALLFGSAHLLGGPLSAVVNVMVGYLLYLCLRVSGTIVVPIVVHAIADFSIFSEFTTEHAREKGVSSPVQALAQIGLLILVLIASRSIWPKVVDPLPGASASATTVQ